VAWLIPGGRSRRRQADREDRYAAELGELQLAAMKAVMAKAHEALDRNEFEVYSSLSSQVFDAGYQAPRASSDLQEPLTRHERNLDGWRIVTTIVLVAGLLIVVGLVLFTKTSTNAATPFISLVSGLAGIALGWMFAGAGNSNIRKRSETSPKRATRQPAAISQPGTTQAASGPALQAGAGPASGGVGPASS
jgi:hypothetical protein